MWFWYALVCCFQVALVPQGSIAPQTGKTLQAWRPRDAATKSLGAQQMCMVCSGGTNSPSFAHTRWNAGQSLTRFGAPNISMMNVNSTIQSQLEPFLGPPHWSMKEYWHILLYWHVSTARMTVLTCADQSRHVGPGESWGLDFLDIDPTRLCRGCTCRSKSAAYAARWRPIGFGESERWDSYDAWETFDAWDTCWSLQCKDSSLANPPCRCCKAVLSSWNQCTSVHNSIPVCRFLYCRLTCVRVCSNK